MVERQPLNGMKEICQVLGRSEPTVLDLKRKYPNTMPVQKINHVWVSEKSALLDWWHRLSKGELSEVLRPAPPEQEAPPGGEPAWAAGKTKAELVAWAQQELSFAGVTPYQKRPEIVESIRAELERREQECGGDDQTRAA